MSPRSRLSRLALGPPPPAAARARERDRARLRAAGRPAPGGGARGPHLSLGLSVIARGKIQKKVKSDMKNNKRKKQNNNKEQTNEMGQSDMRALTLYTHLSHSP